MFQRCANILCKQPGKCEKFRCDKCMCCKEITIRNSSYILAYIKTKNALEVLCFCCSIEETWDFRNEITWFRIAELLKKYGDWSNYFRLTYLAFSVPLWCKPRLLKSNSWHMNKFKHSTLGLLINGGCQWKLWRHIFYANKLISVQRPEWMSSNMADKCVHSLSINIHETYQWYRWKFILTFSVVNKQPNE